MRYTNGNDGSIHCPLNSLLLVMLSETKHLSWSLRINPEQRLTVRFFATLRMIILKD
jgi:hypothetical protein